MEVTEKKTDLPIRQQVKAQLLNHEFINKYLNEYGRPYCFCCNELVAVFIPARAAKFIRIYCLNCGITTRAVGVCKHMDL